MNTAGVGQLEVEVDGPEERVSVEVVGVLERYEVHGYKSEDIPLIK